MTKEQTNIDDLKEKTSMLLKLLGQPSPGTFSWHEMVHKLAGEIGEYGTFEITHFPLKKPPMASQTMTPAKAVEILKATDDMTGIEIALGVLEKALSDRVFVLEVEQERCNQIILAYERQIKALQQRLDKVERWTDMPDNQPQQLPK